MISPNFPESVIKYSALKHLQKKIVKKCNALPKEFTSLKEWEEYRIGLVTWLKEKLPVWDIEDPRSSIQTAEIELGEDLMLESVDVHFEEEFYIPVHLYRGKKENIKRPVIIVCPGYGQKKTAPDIISICIALAKSGFTAVAIEYDATGERADSPDFLTNENNVTALAYLMGMNNVGLRVMNNLAALRYIKTRDDVDSCRIGITGLCQGSIVSWYTAAVCEEITATALLCGATTHEAITLEYCNRQGGWTQISPYFFNLFDHADIQHIIASIAPRPLYVQNNIVDLHWPYSGFEKVKELSEQVYGLYNKAENCKFRVENGSHAYEEPFNSNIVRWFLDVFKITK